MKNNFYLILLISTISTSGCKKDKSVSILEGEWELRTELNSKTGRSTNYLPGNGTIMKFTGTDYQMYAHEKFVKSGTYTIRNNSSKAKAGVSERIIYDGGSGSGSVNTFMKIDSTQIRINPETNPDLSSIYKKIKF